MCTVGPIYYDGPPRNINSEFLGPKKSKKRAKKLPLRFAIRILAANPLLYLQVVCTCCRNAYARVRDDASLEGASALLRVF